MLVTGFLMLGGFGGMALLSNYYMRKYCFHVFHVLHFIINALIITCGIIHGTTYAFYGMGVWGLDLIIRIILICKHKKLVKN